MTSQELEKPRGKSKNGHYSPGAIDAQALRAMELKVKGWSDQAIAEDLGVSRVTAANRIRHAVATLGPATVTEYREIAKQRYEALIKAALDAADPDNALEVVRVVGDLNAKYARLVGAEAPPQVDVHVTVETEQEKSLREMLAQAERDEKARETVIVEGEVVE
jgi:DNA-binding Lrp family transcriptional regulator